MSEIYHTAGEVKSSKGTRAVSRRMSSRLLAALAAATAAVGASSAMAQSNYTGATNGQWGTASNWSAGVPNAVGATANISSAVTVNVSDTGTGGLYPYTFGTITDTSTASGSVVIGNNGVTTDILNAQVSSGTPTINITSANQSIFMYANILGTQGLTKTGAGKLTFRFNGSTQTYSGPIVISGGIFGAEGDFSLGDVSNGVSIANGARLTFEPGNGGNTINVPDTRLITLTGAQSQIGASGAAVVVNIAGTIAGTSATGLVKTDAGRLNLNGPLTFSGLVKNAGGVMQFNPPSLTFSTVDDVTCSGAVGTAGSTTGTVIDFSLLTNYTQTAPTKTMTILPATDATTAQINRINLALGGASGGINNITVATVQIGGAAGSSQGAGHTGILGLGTTNSINANTFNMGGFNGAGSLAFQSGVGATPTLTLRGTAGGSTPVNVLNLGSTSSGARTGEGKFDLTGGTIDGIVTTMIMNAHIANANNNATSSFTMPGGTMTIGTLVMNDKLNAGAPALTSNFNQQGGTVSVGSIIMGRSNAQSYPNMITNYNLGDNTLATSGTLKATSIVSSQAGGNGGISQPNINFNNGVITHRDASTDLDIAGRINPYPVNFNIAADGTHEINSPAGRTTLVESTVRLLGTGDITKTGDGTLIINGTNGRTALPGDFKGRYTVGGGKLVLVAGSGDTGMGNPDSTTADSISLNGTTLSLNRGIAGSLTLDNAGSGYTSIPTVSFSNVTGATGLVKVSTFTLAVTPNTGVYNTDPTIFVSSPDQLGTQMTVTAVRTGTSLTGVNITQNGSGYTTMPVFTIGAPASGTAAAINVTGLSLAGVLLSNNGYDFNGTTPVVTLNGGGGSGGLASATGTDTGDVNVPSNRGVTLGSSGGTLEAIGTQTINGDVTGAGSLSKTGSGKLVMAGTLTQAGNTVANAGELVLQKPLVTATGSLGASGAGAQVTLAAPASNGSNIVVADVAGVGASADGKVVLSATDRSSNLQTVVVTAGLTIANDGAALGSRVYSGTVDVTNNDMIVRNGSVADVSDMARAAQTGNPNLLFGAAGLTSANAAADAGGLLRYAVGVIKNDIDGVALYDTFDGQAVGLTDVLVKFTYFGDADLNGIVDDSDFFLVNNGYGNTLTGWINGDFDYSGTIDDTDFFLINNGYGAQGPALRAGGSVPEPTGMGLIAVGAGLLAARRRKM